MTFWLPRKKGRGEEEEGGGALFKAESIHHTHTHTHTHAVQQRRDAWLYGEEKRSSPFSPPIVCSVCFLACLPNWLYLSGFWRHNLSLCLSEEERQIYKWFGLTDFAEGSLSLDRSCNVGNGQFINFTFCEARRKEDRQERFVRERSLICYDHGSIITQCDSNCFFLLTQ